jgi:hypothetical protein
MRTEYVGLVNGLKTWNVYNDAGEFVGMNQSMPVAVPETITAVQIRKWLVARGIALEDVTSAIEALPDDVRANTKIEWEYEPVIHRSSAMLVRMAQAFGMNDGAIDAAFMEAAGL